MDVCQVARRAGVDELDATAAQRFGAGDYEDPLKPLAVHPWPRHVVPQPTPMPPAAPAPTRTPSAQPAGPLAD